MDIEYTFYQLESRYSIDSMPTGTCMTELRIFSSRITKWMPGDSILQTLYIVGSDVYIKPDCQTGTACTNIESFRRFEIQVLGYT